MKQKNQVSTAFSKFNFSFISDYLYFLKQMLITRMERSIKRARSSIPRNHPTLKKKQMYHILTQRKPRLQQEKKNKKDLIFLHKRQRISLKSVEKGRNNSSKKKSGRQKGISGNFSLSYFKNRMKNVLMRMSYKEKLNHIEALLTQARYLCQSYGYFYITYAMIRYVPENQIKLSIWIHPDVQRYYRIHPIQKESLADRNFYRNLKNVFLELFPTIPLGEGESYSSINSHILNLKLSLKKKSCRKPSKKQQQNQKQLSLKKANIFESTLKREENKVVNISVVKDFESIFNIDEKTSLYEDTQNEQELLDQSFQTSLELSSQKKQLKTKEDETVQDRSPWQRELEQELNNILFNSKSDINNCWNLEESRNTFLQTVTEQFGSILY